MHYVSGSGHERSLLFASLLLDAGADINARCDPGNLAGRTALAWALADDCLGLCGIKFRASHAIDATCLHLRDGVAIPRHRRDVVPVIAPMAW